MSATLTNIYQDGKIFKEIDFQIMIRKDKIRTHEKSIEKSYKLAGVDGPRGMNGLGLDYSRVTSSTPAAHIGLEDALRLIERDKVKILLYEAEISELRNRKRNLIKIFKSLDSLEQQIFYYRVIMMDTQEDAANKIGVSRRHLQRVEKLMRESSIAFEFLNTESN
jgi:DNA-binding XRE family transcriptional regulator